MGNAVGKQEGDHPLAVRVRGLEYTYPDGRRALDGVDLEVARGERVAILGPNGAGKSTLALHLNGILRAQGGGLVEVTGLRVERANLAAVRARVGIVFQDPDDQLFMPNVWRDVSFGPANLGLDGEELTERVGGALAAVGMGYAGERAPSHLSFGEKRRVALAGVLAMRPEVLVLDEPQSNLDPVARRDLAGVLRGLDVTLLMVAHDLPYAASLCERAVLMDEGRIVADGPILEVLGNAELLDAHRMALPYGFVVPGGAGGIGAGGEVANG